MIISASYKTDIPAFYGEWFINRIRAGYCKMSNPYNRRPVHVPLTPESVDGFVFWTKNLGPFLQSLDELRAFGRPFVVQYSINGYPRSLESAVVDVERAASHLHSIRERYGPKVAVWRYDPIVFASATPREFHLENFRSIAERVEGATDEVVISFAQIYRKTKRNMDAAAGTAGFEWHDPDASTKREMVTQLAEMADARGMRLTVCSQRELVAAGAGEAECVSAQRLSSIAGSPVSAARKGNRPDCACSESRDIGEYDTCPHGCVYCYAVADRTLARARYKQHDPKGEFLFEPGC